MQCNSCLLTSPPTFAPLGDSWYTQWVEPALNTLYTVGTHTVPPVQRNRAIALSVQRSWDPSSPSEAATSFVLAISVYDLRFLMMDGCSHAVEK